MWYKAVIFCIAFWAGLSAGQSFEKIEIDKPFVDPKALENLHKAYPGIATGLDPYLAKIDNFSYEFTRYEQCPIPSMCDSRLVNRPHYKVIRTVSLDISFLMPSVSGALTSQEEHGCSDMTFTNRRRLFTTSEQIGFGANVKIHKRACGRDPIFGNDWSTDLATASGNLTVSANLIKSNPDFVNKTTLGDISINFGDPDIRINNNDLLGFINANSVVGQILTGILKATKFSLDLNSFRTFDFGIGKLIDFIQLTNLQFSSSFLQLSEVNQIGSLSGYLQQQENFSTPNYDYFLNVDPTIFSEQSSHTQLLISSFIFVYEQVMPNYYAAKVHEKEVISNLSKTARTYLTKQGDSFWSIAKQEYGAGSYMYLIADANPSLNFKHGIKPNFQLVLPQKWEFVLQDSQILRPGDSLWRYWKKACTLTDWATFSKSIPAGSKSANKVFPLQVVPSCV